MTEGGKLHTQHFALRKGQCKISCIFIIMKYYNLVFHANYFVVKGLFVHICYHPDEFTMFLSIHLKQFSYQICLI